MLTSRVVAIVAFTLGATVSSISERRDRRT